ncbi:MAG: hypothetical protein KAI95_06315, partial [Bacteroidales bacterium]|nr:hypothetical protein [Bacteroidales bacterium]
IPPLEDLFQQAGMSLPDYLKGSSKENEATTDVAAEDMADTTGPDKPSASEDSSEPSSPDEPELPEE